MHVGPAGRGSELHQRWLEGPHYERMAARHGKADGLEAAVSHAELRSRVAWSPQAESEGWPDNTWKPGNSSWCGS